MFVACKNMDKLIYKNKDIEIRSWDVVKLSNGMTVGIFGGGYEHVSNDMLPFDDNTPICLLTSPFSSITSTCYPEHVIEVIERCGCFENQINYCYEHCIKQPLYIKLERGQKE